MRGLEGADALPVRAGEGAALVPEELRLDERVADGAAVHHHEGLAGARAVIVDGPRRQLLARAGLADEDARQIGRRELGQEREDRAHGVGRPVEPAEVIGAADVDALPLLARLEDDLRVPEPDARAGRQEGLADRRSVQERAVGGVEVAEHVPVALHRDDAVPPAHRGVGQDEIVVRRGADRELRGGDLHLEPAVGPVRHEQAVPVLEHDGAATVVPHLGAAEPALRVRAVLLRHPGAGTVAWTEAAP
ncbi:MAG: hypothetical protein M5U28_26615 [Sandaracinaceae bacterium]|nr:hypothetical protein [Sandaracinaceae bacterium]